MKFTILTLSSVQFSSAWRHPDAALACSQGPGHFLLPTGSRYSPGRRRPPPAPAPPAPQQPSPAFCLPGFVYAAHAEGKKSYDMWPFVAAVFPLTGFQDPSTQHGQGEERGAASLVSCRGHAPHFGDPCFCLCTRLLAIPTFRRFSRMPLWTFGLGARTRRGIAGSPVPAPVACRGRTGLLSPWLHLLPGRWPCVVLWWLAVPRLETPVTSLSFSCCIVIVLLRV